MWTPQKHLTKRDHETLVAIGKNAKSVIEFGPGESTKAWLEAEVPEIVSLECHDSWRETLKERFNDFENVKIDFFRDTMPVEVPDWVNSKRFDVAFVDSPRGTPARKRHAGFEDCSRINTCLKALELADVVYLHDLWRGLERGTVARLHGMGFRHEIIDYPESTWEVVKGNPKETYGLAKIYGKNASRASLQDA